MNTLEKEILEIFDVEFSIMDHKIINKFEDYYCDNIKISYEQDDEELEQDYLS